MNLDNFLYYNRVCIGFIATYESKSDRLLNLITNYIGNKSFILQENDNVDSSLREKKYIISYKMLDNHNIQTINHMDNFLIFKHPSYISLGNGTLNTRKISDKVVYTCDLVLIIDNDKIHVLKDKHGYFMNKDLSILYNDIHLNMRYLKLKKLINTQNEKFTKNRKTNSIHIKA